MRVHVADECGKEAPIRGSAIVARVGTVNIMNGVRRSSTALFRSFLHSISPNKLDEDVVRICYPVNPTIHFEPRENLAMHLFQSKLLSNLIWKINRMAWIGLSMDGLTFLYNVLLFLDIVPWDSFQALSVSIIYCLFTVTTRMLPMNVTIVRQLTRKFQIQFALFNYLVGQVLIFYLCQNLSRAFHLTILGFGPTIYFLFLDASPFLWGRTVCAMYAVLSWLAIAVVSNPEYGFSNMKFNDILLEVGSNDYELAISLNDRFISVIVNLSFFLVMRAWATVVHPNSRFQSLTSHIEVKNTSLKNAKLLIASSGCVQNRKVGNWRRVSNVSFIANKIRSIATKRSYESVELIRVIVPENPPFILEKDRFIAYKLFPKRVLEYIFGRGENLLVVYLVVLVSPAAFYLIQDIFQPTREVMWLDILACCIIVMFPFLTMVFLNLQLVPMIYNKFEPTFILINALMLILMLMALSWNTSRVCCYIAYIPHVFLYILIDAHKSRITFGRVYHIWMAISFFSIYVSLYFGWLRFQNDTINVFPYGNTSLKSRCLSVAFNLCALALRNIYRSYRYPHRFLYIHQHMESKIISKAAFRVLHSTRPEVFFDKCQNAQDDTNPV